jgi:tetratricopeptide (TPR) repeat protein
MIKKEIKIRIPMDKSNIHSEIKISFDNDFITRYYKVTPAQAKLLKELAIRMHGKIDKVLLRKLEKLSKENPNLPQLKNYITVAYNKLGNVAKSLEINDQLLKEFPDYLHARLNAANHYIHAGEPDKALEFLGKNLDLKESFPARSEFHFSEVQAYCFSTVLYAIAKKDLPLAENRLAFYKAIDQENPRIEELEEHVEYLKIYLAFDKESVYDDLYDFIENSPPVTDRIESPVFHHPEIHQLYQLGFKKAMPVFEVILALPRATVIQDLELVLQDGIERYPYFSDKEWSVFTHSFPLHALFLLLELKATESLDSILGFLQYEEDFLELYIGDFLTEEVWQCVYLLGKEKPILLKEFLLKPGVYGFAKSAVSQALIQISILEPHRSEEIEAMFEELLCFFINAKEEDNVIDPTFLGLMIGDVADAQFITLFPLVEKLYDLDYIDKSIEGDFEDFMKNHYEYSMSGSNYKLQTLSEIYSSSDFCEESEPKKELYQSPLNQSKVIQMPINTVKVNRNDPCLCGSGKKYKKCCG